MKKICVVTATRAEYGLLKPLMELIQKSEDFQLQVIATGTHLSPEFGLTYKQIEEDGFLIDEKVEMLLSSDTPSSIVKSMGLTMMGFADVLPKLNPDILVILGDRYEMLTVASSAVIFKIPIVHIHGGEITEGAYDDSFRHAITKMSNIHFTSTEEYRQRVIQLGESPNSVFNVGAIGLDNIYNFDLLSKEEVQSLLGLKFNKYNYLVTYHPETLADKSVTEQFQCILNAIEKQKESFFVFTYSNADTDGRVINQMIDDYVSKNPNKSKAFSSLGTLRFLSLLKYCDAIVGNSSSGIIEAPSLSVPTINIGNRQKGRVQASSIINVECSKKEICEGFYKISNVEFKLNLKKVKNPYDQGGAAQNIINHLLSIKDINTRKTFFDLL